MTLTAISAEPSPFYQPAAPTRPQTPLWAVSAPPQEVSTPPPPPPSYRDSLPKDTLHKQLWGRVAFHPYPADSFVLPADAQTVAMSAAKHAMTRNPDDELVRVFIGQLPYFVTDMQLSWLCYTFGGGVEIVLPERIMKRQPCGERLPTGCVHACCSRGSVAQLSETMHKKLLVDDTGVWYADTDREVKILAAYVASMHKHKKLRKAHRPYDTVVVQLARSTFVPHKPTSLDAPPETPQAPAYATGIRRQAQQRKFRAEITAKRCCAPPPYGPASPMCSPAAIPPLPSYAM